VGDEPEVRLVLSILENGERPVEADFGDHFFLTPEAVGIAVVVQFGQALAGRSSGFRMFCRMS
jgi:hypothetical protein